MKVLVTMIFTALFASSFAQAGDFETVKVGKSKIVFLKDTLLKSEEGSIDVANKDGKTCSLIYGVDIEVGTYKVRAGTEFRVISEKNYSTGLGLNIGWGPLPGNPTGDEATESLMCEAGLTLQDIQAMLKSVGLEIR